MSELQKAFAGLKKIQPEHPGTQATTPRHESGVDRWRRQGAKPGPVPLPLEGTAKSRHPEYNPVKVFLRKDTHKAAGRKWEDAEGGDFSDLVEYLLQEYLRA